MTQPAPIETMTYKMINGLQDIAADYDAFILDIWGVLHDGIAPFAGTIECLENLQSAGKTVCLLS
ncbi:MAG: TIGR01459 family HAD-type hydrolase, partial [Pseudomonadota bacterium]|nr:TIGR01459 family HAD-type hydrolase [Pseudomonadota bacterium]